MAKHSTNIAKSTTTTNKSTIEDAPHLKVLSIHKEIYDRYIATGEIINLHPHIKDEIANAYRVEHPHFHYNRTCPACVIEMLCTVYNWYNQKIKQ